MFVKWKPGRLTKGRGPQVMWDKDVRLAYLVRSVRTERGPRHEHICYIGSFIDLEDPKNYKDIEAGFVWEIYGCRKARARRFWKDALRNLERAGIRGADLEQAIASLEKTIPRPEDADDPGGD
jgi:hypothetical protein